jgi:hypothetical protein
MVALQTIVNRRTLPRAALIDRPLRTSLPRKTVIHFLHANRVAGRF